MPVVGVNNTSLSHFIAPKLTTMDQNMFVLGTTRAVELNAAARAEN